MKNPASLTEGWHPSEVREEGVGRDVESAALNHDPAPADLDQHLRNIQAFKRGQEAKANGDKRQPIASVTRQLMCWLAGYDGGSMPEFEERDHGSR